MYPDVTVHAREDHESSCHKPQPEKIIALIGTLKEKMAAVADQTSESEKAIVRMETKIEYIIKGVDEIKSEVNNQIRGMKLLPQEIRQALPGLRSQDGSQCNKKCPAKIAGHESGGFWGLLCQCKLTAPDFFKARIIALGFYFFRYCSVEGVLWRLAGFFGLPVTILGHDFDQLPAVHGFCGFRQHPHRCVKGRVPFFRRRLRCVRRFHFDRRLTRERFVRCDNSP